MHGLQIVLMMLEPLSGHFEAYCAAKPESFFQDIVLCASCLSKIVLPLF